MGGKFEGRAKFKRSSASVFMLSKTEESASGTAAGAGWWKGDGSFSDRGRFAGRSAESAGSDGNSDMADAEFWEDGR